MRRTNDSDEPWTAGRFSCSLLVLACALTLACGNADPARQALASVEGGLLPAVVVEGRSLGPWSLAERMNHYGVAAASIAVIDDGELLWSRTYELSDGVGERALSSSDGETRLVAPGLSRVVLGPAIMLLVQRDLVELDDRLGDRLSSATSSPHADSLTVERALAGTSGLGPVDLGGAADLETALASLRIDVRPGLRRRSSEAESLVLQRLIEDAISSSSLQDAMMDLLFEPVGMRSTRFSQDGAASGALGPHDRWGRSLAEPSTLAPWRVVHAGLSTTAEDLARLGLELMRSVGSEGTVFESGVVEEILRPRLGAHGLGFDVHGEGRFGHSDRSALLRFDSATRSGAVILTSGGRGLSLAREVYRAAAQHHGWDHKGPEIVVPASVGDGVARAVSGRYQSDRGRLQIVQQDGQLRLEGDAGVLLPGRVEGPLYQVAGGFRMLEVPELHIAVDRDAQALVRGLELGDDDYARRLGATSRETVSSDEEGY